MKTIALTLGIALLGVSVGACGGAAKRGGAVIHGGSEQSAPTSPAISTVAATRTVPPPTPRGAYLNDGDKDHIGDPDRDNGGDTDKDAWLDYKRDDNNSYHDLDDSFALSTYGSPSTPRVRVAVTKLVERYYGAIAADNTALACSLVLPILATATPLDAGKLGPAFLHGAKTCRQVMNLLSRHFRAQLRAPVVVTGVRQKSGHAIAELGSRLLPAGWITVEDERGEWRIAQLFNGPIE